MNHALPPWAVMLAVAIFVVVYIVAIWAATS